MIKTDYGRIKFYFKSNSVVFIIEEFILPVHAEDVPYLQEYISKGIDEILSKMVDIFHKYFDKFRIKIINVFVIKNYEIGLLFEQNIYHSVKALQGLVKIPVYADNSKPYFKEIEVRREPYEAINIITDLLNFCFRNRIYSWGVEG